MTFVDLNTNIKYECEYTAETGCAAGSAGGDDDGDRTIVVRSGSDQWL